MVEETKKKKKKPEPVPTPPPESVITDPQGRAIGIVSPKGEVFLGARPGEIKQAREGRLPPLAEAQAAKVSPQVQEAFLKEVKAEEQQLPVSPVQEAGLVEGEIPEPEGITQRVAEAGLAIPAGIAEGILSSIEKVSGKKLKQRDALDIAETPAGQALGISFVAAGAAALTVAATAAITTATAAATGGLAKAIGPSALIGGAAILGFKTDVIVDMILKRERATELQGAITTVGQMNTDIIDLVRDGGISPATGIARINSLETDLNILEGRIKQAAILDPQVKQSGQQFDIMQGTRTFSRSFPVWINAVLQARLRTGELCESESANRRRRTRRERYKHRRPNHEDSRGLFRCGVHYQQRHGESVVRSHLC
jgi:hypothetical protein